MPGFFPNTRVDILRGTAVDDYGDEMDSAVPAAENVPAVIAPMVRTVRSPETGRIMSVLYADGTVAFRVDARQGDRLLDKTTGEVWVVDQVIAIKMAMQGDKRLKLRHFNGNAVE
jgi:hypothetical protein